jgi:hypothetical protein
LRVQSAVLPVSAPSGRREAPPTVLPAPSKFGVSTVVL